MDSGFVKRLLEDDFKDKNPKQSDNSLRVLGWLAITLGVIVVVVGVLVYGQDWFRSISESATYYGTAYILPFILGGMTIYFLGYRGYAKIDRIFAKIMAAAAFVTSVFQCKTQYNISAGKIGLLGVSTDVSNLWHSVGAMTLFLFLACWIGFLFTRTKEGTVTPQKKVRKRVFAVIALIMLVGIGFVTCGMICESSSFPFVFWGEIIILIPAGIAILTKAGSVPWLNDN